MNTTRLHIHVQGSHLAVNKKLDDFLKGFPKFPSIFNGNSNFEDLTRENSSTCCVAYSISF